MSEPRWKSVILTAALLGCHGGSSKKPDTLQLQMVDGVWRIDTTEDAPTICTSYFTVSGADGTIYWEIAEMPVVRGGSPKTMICTGDFPIIYGETPPWLREISPPKPLKGRSLYYFTAGKLDGSAWLP